MDVLYVETNNLVQQVHQGVAQLERTTDPGAASQIETAIADHMRIVIKNCDKLDMLCENQPLNRRRYAKQLVEQLRYDCDQVQAALLSMQKRFQATKEHEDERQELLSRRFTPNAESTCIHLEDAAATHNLKLRSAHSNVDNMIDAGRHMLANLQEQGLSFKNFKKKILDIGSTLGFSRTVMQFIERRSDEDMKILYSSCLGAQNVAATHFKANDFCLTICYQLTCERENVHRTNCLNITNSNELKSRDTGSFIQLRSVEFIFVTCDRFNLSAETRFLSVVLFDKFMTAHVQSVWQSLCENCEDEESLFSDWESVLTKLRGQMVLRMVTCVQLSSKLCDSSTEMTTSSVKDFLKYLGQYYTDEQIIKSELRVIKTLDFNVDLQTPLHFIKVLLELISVNFSWFCEDEVLSLCLDYLNFVFLQRREIYEIIFSSINDGSRKQVTRDELYGDFMYLACSVVLLAVQMLLKPEHVKMVDELLKGKTQYSLDNLKLFGCSLIRYLGSLTFDD